MEKSNLFYIREVEIVYKNGTIPSERINVVSSWTAADVLRDAIGENIDYKETFYIMLLNNANHVLGISKISTGTTTATVVDVKMIMQRALLAHATGIILAHNHPSGTLKPSEADKRLTTKIKTAAEYLDLKILDHLIITSESYFSFADESIL